MVGHIRREEGHGVFKDVEDKNSAKLLAIQGTFIWSKIGNSPDEKNNVSCEINGNVTVGAHTYVLLRSAEVERLKNMSFKHPFSFISPIMTTDLHEVYLRPVWNLQAVYLEQIQQIEDHVGTYLFIISSQLVALKFLHRIARNNGYNFAMFDYY